MKFAIARVEGRTWEELRRVLVSRYPNEEWVTFFRFGWRLTEPGLILSVVDLIRSQPGDIDDSVSNVKILEPYIVRAALETAATPLAVGVIHSHPESCAPIPSRIDDEMDEYFRQYFGSFLPNRPYASLILSTSQQNSVQLSGRVWMGGDGFLKLQDLSVVGQTLTKYSCEPSQVDSVESNDKSRARLLTFYGRESGDRLRRSTVTVVGCGGTGSPAAHVLARAGVGRMVLIDPDRFESSNLERMHGSESRHIRERPFKVGIVAELCRRINPNIEIVQIVGNALQPLATDWLVQSDLVLSCTDTNHSRVGLSELAYRYIVPVIDTGVLLDGSRGRVVGEVIQVTHYYPGGPCAYCRSLVDSWRLTVEMMPESEREVRRQAAEAAVTRGESPNQYWRDQQQLLTVGHVTTAAGSIAASYAIGVLTEKFLPPAPHFQIDLLADRFGFVRVDQDAKSSCACQEIIGFGDQGAARGVISVPSHWPEAYLLE